MAEENKKKSGLKKVKKALKIAALFGGGALVGVAIENPTKMKKVCNEVIGFIGGLFKKTADPCEVDAADLSEATTEVRSDYNNNGGWQHRPAKFNIKERTTK